jgi:predicted MFS family arabinose efflux permease
LDAAGGPLRARVLILFAGVLALDTADVSMIGAIASKLETALRISNTELGVLASVPSVVAAVATVPVGVLTDRTCRMRLLTSSIVIWGIAMAASAASPSFAVLLLTRLALGAANATAGPTVSSLIGDYFPVRERGRVYGIILSGELLGAGIGFVLAGEIASVLTWRAGFVVLALPSLALAYLLWRKLPEPARGGTGRLKRGATRFVDPDDPAETPPAGEGPELTVAQKKVERLPVDPDEELVLRDDPARLSLWEATKYVLRVRTNLILVVTSALGYFYLTGMETFGQVYVRRHYGLGQGTSTLVLGALGLGGLVGVLAGGGLADRLIARGDVNGRITVGGWSFVIATGLLVPALLGRSLIWTLPLLIAASAAFAARNPALDAARLDIMHHRLWGRAEAVRTFLRRLMVATAPVAFGALADALDHGAATSGHYGFGADASVSGLHLALLILSVTLVLGGLLTFRARRTYPRDVATAVASEEATKPGREQAPARAA